MKTSYEFGVVFAVEYEIAPLPPDFRTVATFKQGGLLWSSGTISPGTSTGSLLVQYNTGPFVRTVACNCQLGTPRTTKYLAEFITHL